ncbi:hypothetical protein EG329_004514 [Mollisiaceae sp. DMI_Dod_QoI]|nr:hypothetical protein EG329_004514 [Helotiales sp. DMI_Dod_QoI]
MPPLSCAICGKDIKLICCVCKSANYCSLECQTKDAPLHELLCDKIESFKISNPRPADSFLSTFKLGLLLPASKTMPELIWFKTGLTYSEEDKQWHYGCDLSQYNNGNAKYFLGHIDDNGREIEVMCGQREEPRNACLEFLLRAGKNGIKNEELIRFTYEFRGSIIVVSLSPYVVLGERSWAKAVVVDNRNDVVLSNRQKYRPIMIRKPQPDQDIDFVSSISEHMGMSLLTQPNISTLQWKAVSGDRAASYQKSYLKVFGILHGAVPSENSTWNRPRLYPLRPWLEFQLGYSSSVTVYRKDGKDLTEHHIEALISYCKEVLHVAMKDEENENDKNAKQAIVDTYMTGAKFCEYFEKLKGKKLAAGDMSWADAAPPICTKSNSAKRAIQQGDLPSPKHTRLVSTDELKEEQRLAKRRKVLESVESRLSEKQSN